jgi:Ca2+-binding RTX toxin-like protein
VWLATEGQVDIMGSRLARVLGEMGGVLCAVLASFLLAAPPPARANVTVSQSGGVGGTTTLTGDAGSDNIRVYWDLGTYGEWQNVWDTRGFPGSTHIIPGPGCWDDGVGLGRVICPDSDVFIGNLGAGDDGVEFLDRTDTFIVYRSATIDGGPGDDELLGALTRTDQYPSRDVFYGGPGVDKLYGDAGDDELHGGDGDDTAIDGGDGNDLILGEDGDDWGLWGGEGNDKIDAGPGDDGRLSYGSTVTFAGDPRHAYARGPEPGADIYIGGPGTDELEWGSGVRVSLDGAANDGDGADNVAGDIERILGSGLNDTLVGDSASQTVVGSSGDDTINPGLGSDVVFGDSESCSMGPWGSGCAAGNDTIDTRDGFIDQVNCGMGVDRLLADTIDVVADGWGTCETIDRTTGPGREQDTTPPAMTLPDRKLTLDRRGYIRVHVRCPAGEPAGCTGTVTLRSASKIKLPGRARRAILTLGAKAYRAPAAATVTVKVHPSGKARSALRRARRLKVRLTVSARDQANNTATVTKTLTVSRR